MKVIMPEEVLDKDKRKNVKKKGSVISN